MADNDDIIIVLTDEIVEISDGDADEEDAPVTVSDEDMAGNVLWPRFGSTFRAGIAAARDKTLLEMFCPPRLVPYFASHGGAGLSKDLKTGWNGMLWEDRSKLLTWVELEMPEIVFGCPPCRMYSKLQMSNRTRVDPAVFQVNLANADVLLDFQMHVFGKQLDGGRSFVFEHPDGASSWKKGSVRSVARREGVFVLLFDQCRYGLKDLQGNPLKKRTKFMSNMISIWNEFGNKFCQCTVPHGQCQGQQDGLSVARHAEVYPPMLAEALAGCCWQHVC
eukprot:9737672-Karenia_brevis.AAC.1